MVSGEGLAMPHTRHAIRGLELSVPSGLEGGEVAFGHVVNALTNHADLMKPQTRKILKQGGQGYFLVTSLEGGTP